MTLLVPIVGCALIAALAIALSEDRRNIDWRVVARLFLAQAAIAAIVLFFPAGRQFLIAAASSVQTVIGYSADGITFLFGALGEQERGFIFAFHVLPVIVFFSSLISVLYFLKIIQTIVRIAGQAMHKLLGTSEAESFAATANIFVGGTEVYLLMRPYAAPMTHSELFALMVGGATSVSGAILVGYAAMGVEIQYLLAAIFMSAPAGLLMAKILVPETERPATMNFDLDYEEQPPINVIEAATSGASRGAQLAITVGAMLLALISLVALLNGLIGLVGGWFGLENLTAERILGYALSPLMLALGIPAGDAIVAGGLLGKKVVLNEFVAFSDLVALRDGLNDHSRIVMTFVLCGFANLATPASLLGVLGVMVPERRQEIAKLAVRVILAGTLANLMSGALASFFVLLR